jgi:hypothetical protein
MPYFILGLEAFPRVSTQNSRQTRGRWNIEASQLLMQLMNRHTVSFFQNFRRYPSQLLFTLKVGEGFLCHPRLLRYPFIKNNFSLYFQPSANLLDKYVAHASFDLSLALCFRIPGTYQAVIASASQPSLL